MKPSTVALLRKSNMLRLEYTDNRNSTLTAEFLRVHSPSAEVRQHGNPILVPGKLHVQLVQVEPVGRYGIKLTFDDGHDSGIYSWQYLRDLCLQQDQLWQDYKQKLFEAKLTRDPERQVVQVHPPASS